MAIKGYLGKTHPHLGVVFHGDHPISGLQPLAVNAQFESGVVEKLLLCLGSGHLGDHTHGEGSSTASGSVVIGRGVGVADHQVHIFGPDAEFFGYNLWHTRIEIAGSHINSPGDQGDGPVLIDFDGGRGRPAAA